MNVTGNGAKAEPLLAKPDNFRVDGSSTFGLHRRLLSLQFEPTRRIETIGKSRTLPALHSSKDTQHRVDFLLTPLEFLNQQFSKVESHRRGLNGNGRGAGIQSGSRRSV